MKTFIRILLICLMAHMPFSSAKGQYLFKTLDSRNLLNSSQINCIMKDSKGFMWFGTPSGLYRYDGYTFKNFQSNSQDGSSLPDSYILALRESFDGNIWVETASGMCVYKPETESFDRDVREVFKTMGITDVPEVEYIDSHKNLWVYMPGRGVLGYNMQQQLLYEFSYTNDIKGIPQGEIVTIGECKDGALLVYRDGSITCCDIINQQHTVWTNAEIANMGIAPAGKLKVYTDANDDIWLYGQGMLAVYRKSTGNWDTSAGERLGLTGAGNRRPINDMNGDSHGNIWIATEGAGLIRTTSAALEAEHVEPKGLSGGQRAELLRNVLCVYVDDTDLLWVGTEKSGAAYYGDDIYKFEYETNGDVTAICQDASGKMWFGTSDNGIIGYSGPLASNRVTCMEYTKDGSIWVGSAKSGLTRIKDGSATIYSTCTDDGNGLIDDHINDLCGDKTGSLWIATSGGLQVYNPRMNSFSTYTQENGKLSTNNITSLYYGKDNNLFVGTNEGLTIINLSTTESQHLIGNKSSIKKFTNDYITQLFQDSRGLLWIGTREGVNILDMESDELYHITMDEGLCNNSINGLGEDKNTNIWISTSNGATRVVVQRDHVEGNFYFSLYNYDKSDGLLSNEFNKGAIMSPSDGNIIMGNLNGVNWIRERSKEAQEALPRVMLTQLFIDETEVLTGHEYGGSVVLPQALNESNNLKLSGSQNTFTIKFAAGNYNQCERLQFMYWMEGKDDGWRNGDALTHGVTFRNLSSGTYTLHVKAVSADGAVSKQERTLTITIANPWWMQWWMILIYIAVLVIVFLVVKVVYNNLSYLVTKKKAVLNELTKQREEIKAASDDLRQPMSRMATIMGNIVDTAENVETQEQVNNLHAQMLQVITRISEMQMYLDKPEEKADKLATSHLELNDQGELKLLTDHSDEITGDISNRKSRLITQAYRVMFIDDNTEFLDFATQQLNNIYEVHTYNDTEDAMTDVETLKPHLIVCKEDMPKISGSTFCNMVKTGKTTQTIKFVLLTDGVMTSQDLSNLNISLAADDYIAKPFNMQEAVMRFNHLLGLSHVEGLSDIIEGEETRRLESTNASMTTATVSYNNRGGKNTDDVNGTVTSDVTTTSGQEEEKTAAAIAEISSLTKSVPAPLGGGNVPKGDYSMNNAMDQQFMLSVEQYVAQNMSRGKIDLEEMASALGMGRVPFFHKVKALTKKTPAELVRDIKLKNACLLLVRTDINLTELASNVGFITADNFINIFKDRFGISPLEYRLRERGKK